jgi:hypothetical protein
MSVHDENYDPNWEELMRQGDDEPEVTEPRYKPLFTLVPAACDLCGAEPMTANCNNAGCDV